MLHPNINSHLVLLHLLPRRTHHRGSINTQHNAETLTSTALGCKHRKVNGHAITVAIEEEGERGRSVVIHCLRVCVCRVVSPVC